MIDNDKQTTRTFLLKSNNHSIIVSTGTTNIRNIFFGWNTVWSNFQALTLCEWIYFLSQKLSSLKFLAHSCIMSWEFIASHRPYATDMRWILWMWWKKIVQNFDWNICLDIRRQFLDITCNRLKMYIHCNPFFCWSN
jgi:hypothetical protein